MPGPLTRVVLTALLASSISCARHPTPVTSPPEATPLRPQLVPQPARVEWKDEFFTLSPTTVIVAPGELAPLGHYLSRLIGLGVSPRPLRVDTDTEAAADNAIVLVRERGSAGGPESYALDVAASAIRISAPDAAGVFYAIQTLRQMLPARFEHRALRPPRRNSVAFEVRIRSASIADRPRFAWRGAMLDVARHFLEVHEVKRFIDLMALHKLNRLHLHLADDQGWRVEIKSWPNLAEHGGRTEVDGGPGGYYTQTQYADIVRYAAERFITVVPEIDMPGHTNAALASYPELNCNGVSPALYTGTDVGFSALCVDKELTYKFVDDVVREIAALAAGPYFHIGGDEVKTLSEEQYSAFITRVQTIVQSHGRQSIGWDEIASTALAPGTIVQVWRPKQAPSAAVARGARVIMSVADRAYLDMKYDVDTPIGLTWAGLISVRTSYDWDPAAVAASVPEPAILGVEAPLWTETAADIRDVEFLAFPRLAAIAEVAWTPQAQRDWSAFRVRLGAQARRWVALGMNFYRSPEIPWP